MYNVYNVYNMYLESLEGLLLADEDEEEGLQRRLVARLADGRGDEEGPEGDQQVPACQTGEVEERVRDRRKEHDRYEPAVLKDSEEGGREVTVDACRTVV